MEQTTSTPTKRPVLLTVLCILTLVVLGFAVIGLIFSVGAGPMSAQQLDTYYQQNSQMIGELRTQRLNEVADLMEKVSRFVEYQNEKFWLVSFVNLLMTGTGIAGVVLMLRRRRIGFHLYIIYNILSVGSVFVAVPFSEVPLAITLVAAFFSALFIFLYSLNLKWLIH